MTSVRSFVDLVSTAEQKGLRSDSKVLLSGISADIEPGRVTALMGGSGSGE
jgi:ABC-type multidrug transport system ATPase subunit